MGVKAVMNHRKNWQSGFARLVLALALVFGIVVSGLVLTSGSSNARAKAPTLRVVNFNLLHGVFCAAETNYCQSPDRVKLLATQLEAAKCPEIVGLQEINANLNNLIKKIQPKFCQGNYRMVFTTPRSLDTEQVLTTLPVKSTKVVKLAGRFRTASLVVLKSALGNVALVVTHQDGDPEAAPLSGGCKGCLPPCTEGTSLFQCQTDVAVNLAEQVKGKVALRVLMGDFNVSSASSRYKSIIAKGWVDSFLSAGNSECASDTGINCTSGRDDKSIEVLKDPNAKQSDRIDFIFVKSTTNCSVAFDSSNDSNNNGLGTELFGSQPAVDGPGGLVWASDHTGVAADVYCAS